MNLICNKASYDLLCKNILHCSFFILTSSLQAKRSDYFYDVVGNRTKLVDESGIETTYNYDSLYRLTKVNGKYYKKEGHSIGSIYTYDQVGNRLTYDSKYGKITYEYDESSNRLNRINFNLTDKDMSYMLINYDANGNTIQRDYFRNKDEIFEQELYEYNYDNMMIHYVRHKPVMKSNRIEMEIESELNIKYDVNGMRVIKECYPNTTDSTIYIYEGGEVVLEMTYEQIPKNKHLFTYAGGKKVSRTSFKDDGAIDLDSRKYFHQNFLGSIAMITDKNGIIEEHNKYEPFGDIIWSKSYINTDNNYKFTGKERDKESDLDYFNARYLDTKLGRFMKPDVVKGNIKNPQTINKWVYCNNNPIKYMDENGLDPWVLIAEGDYSASLEETGMTNYMAISFRYKATHFYVKKLQTKGDQTRVVTTKEDLKEELSSGIYEMFILKGHTGKTGNVEFEEGSVLDFSEMNFENIKLIFWATCHADKAFDKHQTIFGSSKDSKRYKVFIGFCGSPGPNYMRRFGENFIKNLARGYTIEYSAKKAYFEEGLSKELGEQLSKYKDYDDLIGNGTSEDKGAFEDAFKLDIFIVGNASLNIRDLGFGNQKFKKK